ncbi:Threonine/homoserine/homoserine lactone efflux protein [Humidesulfovibrio mexicanus]|uniref:Threonine/homoserine/homoserine lactone efflux protein n=1 Tax=Humidesulfovibrio mexicanus TaxID=147047 RepID=A0A239ARD3_9BACT|nr:LysE family translocator [Humidesulfovibrio mexicanus]SNR97911.1 Threonine/homoserine/homoserine lactone efflux protein [Humidesulfovibrio mexicanus]
MTAALTIEGAAALALATFVFAAIPGPGVAAVVGQALARGFVPAFLWGVGIILGDAFYLFSAMLGLSVLAQQLGWGFTVLKWAGAAYLAYLGLRCLLAPPAPVAAEAAPGTAREHRSLARTFAGGFCVSLGNPKVIAFYCGFLPGFVDMRALSAPDMLLVAMVILPTCLGVVSLYAWLAARGRGAALGGRTWGFARRGAGLVMLGAAVAVVAE